MILIKIDTVGTEKEISFEIWTNRSLPLFISKVNVTIDFTAHDPGELSSGCGWVGGCGPISDLEPEASMTFLT